jgi:hypothetical protein
MKKILGSALFLVVLAAGWFIYHGGVKGLLGEGEPHVTAANAPAAGAASSGWSDSDTPKTASSTPSGPAPTGDTLKAILGSGVVRVSVENPSKPFYS